MSNDEPREQFNVKLSKAERSALRILAALGDLSMADHIRENAIIALWKARFPNVPLGRDPYKRSGNTKTKEEA